MHQMQKDGKLLNPIIKAENLTHIYSAGTPFEHVAIHNVQFEAQRGEFIGIIGHTGSGKSTFIQHLNGLLKPVSGKVYFDGQDIYQSKEITRDTRFKVGLVFQYPEYQLFEETVYKDISFGPRNMKLSAAEVDERVHEAAGFVGLPDEILEKSPFELSGGQKRRVAIAGVIAMRPQVLILDEPTAGLDPAGSASIISNIRQFHRHIDSTVIMVSHSMEDVAQNADRLVVFDGGTIVMDGTPAQVFSRSRELLEMGLSVPKVTMVADRLREMGLALPKDIYTIEQMKNALCCMKRGRVE
jgi:energy-coupling factor transport system ATP-binding protein